MELTVRDRLIESMIPFFNSETGDYNEYEIDKDGDFIFLSDNIHNFFAQEDIKKFEFESLTNVDNESVLAVSWIEKDRNLGMLLMGIEKYN